MEKIIGINEARPKLSSIIEALDKPIIITVNSEPKSVLMRYDEYLRLSKVEQENKRLALKLALEKLRGREKDTDISETDISKEIMNYRNSKMGGENK
ncbi:type II toxin-antitoxin system Phd/YefM family antitoxin [Desulfallas sp. Bu1-1]|jgi:antitoxin YefM|uniref:type II toxin-antitoxin system Phd/YefM family antitoxin n=1 Tax=Desulfallas sp. Bu1-1 TaxID=2787620 RepID=UPI0018A0D6AD|nr:type II toxin-antitoxin system Phd/YefM family antitoxin [Desulfallas sp. Bu1-1]MBF7084641.1 type II toxin-antitoxin system Phd/YefM family antitoxin [Desulfallas sp. Bu1-1]